MSKDRGFEPQARLDLEGVQAVLELPSRYGVPRKALSAAREYYDLSYYELAFASDDGAIAVAPAECDVPGAPKQDRPRSVDIAKRVFLVHGADRSGGAVWRRQLRRAGTLKALTEKLEPDCEIGMEACSGAHLDTVAAVERV